VLSDHSISFVSKPFESSLNAIFLCFDFRFMVLNKNYLGGDVNEEDDGVCSSVMGNNRFQ